MINLSLAGFGYTLSVLLLSCSLIEVTNGSGIKFPPAGNETQIPKSAPLLLFAGVKKPDANATNEAPPKFKVAKGALYVATITAPDASVTEI